VSDAVVVGVGVIARESLADLETVPDNDVELLTDVVPLTELVNDSVGVMEIVTEIEADRLTLDEAEVVFNGKAGVST
jgi:hypothetical protein